MAARKIQTREIAKSINKLVETMSLDRGYDEAKARKLGYFSIEDFAKITKYSLSHATKLLKESVHMGQSDEIEVKSKRGRRLFYRSKQ